MNNIRDNDNWRYLWRIILRECLHIRLGGTMSLADTQYLNIIENILDHGIYGQNRTGIATYKLPQQIMQFDLQEEFPILNYKVCGLSKQR